jgi:hypothetical protein
MEPVYVKQDDGRELWSVVMCIEVNANFLDIEGCLTMHPLTRIGTAFDRYVPVDDWRSSLGEPNPFVRTESIGSSGRQFVTISRATGEVAAEYDAWLSTLARNVRLILIGD